MVGFRAIPLPLRLTKLPLEYRFQGHNFSADDFPADGISQGRQHVPPPRNTSGRARGHRARADRGRAAAGACLVRISGRAGAGSHRRGGPVDGDRAGRRGHAAVFDVGGLHPGASQRPGGVVAYFLVEDALKLVFILCHAPK